MTFLKCLPTMSTFQNLHFGKPLIAVPSIFDIVFKSVYTKTTYTVFYVSVLNFIARKDPLHAEDFNNFETEAAELDIKLST